MFNIQMLFTYKGYVLNSLVKEGTGSGRIEDIEIHMSHEKLACIKC